MTTLLKVAKNLKKNINIPKKRPDKQIYLFLNKPIQEENFIFDDKWGKFFMYSSYCKRFTEESHSNQYKVKIRSDDTSADDKPYILNIETTVLRHAYSKYSPKGSKAYAKMDYNLYSPSLLPLVLENLITCSGGRRVLEKNRRNSLYNLFSAYTRLCHRRRIQRFGVYRYAYDKSQISETYFYRRG